MKRGGGSASGGTEMVFEKGRRVRGLYATPLGNIDMEIVTDDISGSHPLMGQPGKILIDYSISLKGLFDGRKKLEIQILDKDGNEMTEPRLWTPEPGKNARRTLQICGGRRLQAGRPAGCLPKGPVAFSTYPRSLI